VARALWEVNKVKIRMKRLVDFIKDYVKKEDPVLWLSLFIASLVSLAFYAFAVFYVRIAG